MGRWTIKSLKEIDDITFAIAILNERKNSLNRYAPLAEKLSAAARTLSTLKSEKDSRPCEFCKENPKVLFSSEDDMYPYSAEYCPQCGRKLESPTEPS